MKNQLKLFAALITSVVLFTTGCKKETQYSQEDFPATASIVTPEPEGPSLLSRVVSAVGFGPECPGGFNHKSLPFFGKIPKDNPNDVRYWETWRSRVPCDDRFMGYFPNNNKFSDVTGYLAELVAEAGYTRQPWPEGTKPERQLLNSDVYQMMTSGQFYCYQGGNQDCAVIMASPSATESRGAYIGDARYEISQWLSRNCRTVPNILSDGRAAGKMYQCK